MPSIMMTPKRAAAPKRTATPPAVRIDPETGYPLQHKLLLTHMSKLRKKLTKDSASKQARARIFDLIR